MEIQYLIYGFGGHGKVIAEALVDKYGHSVGVFDDQPIISSASIQYLGKYNANLYPSLPIIIGVGNNEVRKKISSEIKHEYLSFIHPSAQVAKSVSIGKGTVVLQNAVVQANSFIGEHVIVNMGAMVDHDNQIGDFVHISPLCYVGSNSVVSDLTCLDPYTRINRFSKI